MKKKKKKNLVNLNLEKKASSINKLNSPEIKRSDVFDMFEKMKNLLQKFFNNNEIVNEDVTLHLKIKKIFIQILMKKKFCRSFNINDFTADKLNKMKNTLDNRRTEERLKFVFKKCIRNIQNEFKSNWKKKKIIIEEEYNENINPLKFDYIFYNYYFNDIAQEIKEPIEKFFHFRNWKNRTNDDIPKSITKKYVDNLKKNKTFMLKFIDYLKNQLLKDIRKSNLDKIEKLIKVWKREILKSLLPVDQSLDIMLRKFKKKRVKLPWTFFEINNAIKETLQHISSD